MKTNWIKTIGFALSLMTIISSCKKEDNLPLDEEGYKSTTESSSEEDDDESTEELETEVILHRHYDADLSKEEVAKAWDEDVAQFMKSHKTSATFSTEYVWRIGTRTGTQTNNDTDAKVYAKIWVNAFYDKRTAEVKLDKSNYNDREGGWDRYLFTTRMSNHSAQWISLRKARLSLQGTDGWYVTNLEVELRPEDQTLYARGGSEIKVSVNKWLDNKYSGNWDRFTTSTYDISESGTVYFP